MNSQGGKRDILSTRKSTHEFGGDGIGATIGGDAEPSDMLDTISKSAAKA